MAATPMTPERWQRVQQVFDAVKDVPPGERPDRLAALCGDDAGLRAEVERLCAGDAFLPDEAPAERPSFYGRAPAEAFALATDPTVTGSVSLVVVEGAHAGARFTFPGHDLFLVGRSRRCHFHLPEKDPYVSRIHLLIEANPPNARVLDMHSHNGTYVNGDRVDVADLHDGDRLKAGRSVFRVEVAADESTADAPALPASEPTRPRIATLPEISGIGSADAEPAVELPHIPGYRLTRELGHGAMGRVYQGVRETDGFAVAVKAIRPPVSGNQNDIHRFLREAEILQQLHHPAIVRYLALGSTLELLFFVMEYVSGTHLEHVLREKGRLPVKTAVRLILPVLDALAYAHARGFVHRDVKPGNVLLTRRPDGRKAVKLVDFGLAKVYQMSKVSGVTLAGETGGTPAYMAPEQITDFRGVKPPADQYSAAALLYHMLTGQEPYDLPAAMPAALLVILNQEPVPLRKRVPELPEGLAKVVHRGLAREPAERYPDVTEFASALWPYAH